MRRPPLSEVRVGRSNGVAEHPQSLRTVLTQPITKRLVAVACACALLIIPTTAHAQTTSERLAATRSAIDAAASRWFAAQNAAANLDTSIASLQHEIVGDTARVDGARRQAAQRAVVMYESASTNYGDVFGADAIDSARRAELIDHANAQNEQAVADLQASLDDLRAQQKALTSQRADLAHALRDVAAQRATLDAQFSDLQAQAQHDAKAAAALEAARHVAAAHASSPTAAPTRPVTISTSPPPSAPPPPATGGESSHHNDPFLVCTRARESNGDYQAVSPDGVYYGAYQFLPSTWDVTANHAGRGDLVGVLPSRASENDQDEMAWALYQWQGKAPWGGLC
jgi:hypothetical protein